MPRMPAALGIRFTICLFFMQDTNALVFRALTAALGVSARHGFDMNSLAVPRKAKEVGNIIIILCFLSCLICVVAPYDPLQSTVRR